MSAPAENRCPLCGAIRDFLYPWRDFLLYRCRRCGTESVQPLPTAAELETFYQSLSGKKMVRWQRRLELVGRAFDGYLRWYAKFSGGRSPRTFLDVGGGVGYHARAAADRGIETCLLDWAADALRFGRERLELPRTVQGDVERCAEVLAGERFDFVMARHVIEHLRDPLRFVDHLGRLLAAGGLLALETPNVETREQLAHPGVVLANHRILRSSNPARPALAAARWAVAKSVSGVNPPKHLWGFTAAGLGDILRSRGFELLDVRRAVAGDRTHDPLYFDLQRAARPPVRGLVQEVWERLASPLFRGRGMNLVILARQLRRTESSK